MSKAISRRAALGSIGIGAAMSTIAAGTATASVCPMSGEDDAELIRLGGEFDRLYAEWRPIQAEMKRLEKVRQAAMDFIGAPWTVETYQASSDACGLTPVNDANDAVMDQLDALVEKVNAVPARSFRGVAVKLRVVRYTSFALSEFDGEVNDLDWDVRCFVLVQREVEALAAGGAL